MMVERVQRARRRLHVALVYNGDRECSPDHPDDRGGTADLRSMIRRMARALRSVGYKVTVVPLARNLFAFQRKLRRLAPDVVFNQYDDVVHGALYEMRLPALVRMMGYPITGSPALAIGLTRYKHMTASLLQGAGIRIPACTELLERLGEVDRRHWQFPLIVQPSHEHAGMGLDRDSVVHSKKALRDKVRARPARIPPAGARAGVSAGAGVQRRHRRRAAAPRHAAGRGRLLATPRRDSADHVLRGQVDRDLRGVQEDLGDLPGQRRGRIWRARSLPRPCARSAPWAPGATGAWTSASTARDAPASSRSTATPAWKTAWAWPGRPNAPESPIRASCR